MGHWLSQLSVRSTKDPTETEDEKDQTDQIFPFVYLPPELRLTIWEYSCQFPRVVAITIDYRRGSYQVCPPPSNSVSGRQVLNHNPALLYVDREARTIALEHYRPAFEQQIARGTLYFNFSQDTIFITNRFAQERLFHPCEEEFWQKPKNSKNSFRQLQHLAISGDCIAGFPLGQVEHKLPRLKTMTAVQPRKSGLECAIWEKGARYMLEGYIEDLESTQKEYTPEMRRVINHVWGKGTASRTWAPSLEFLTTEEMDTRRW